VPGKFRYCVRQLIKTSVFIRQKTLESFYRMKIRGKCKKSFLRKLSIHLRSGVNATTKIFGDAPNIFNCEDLSDMNYVNTKNVSRHERRDFISFVLKSINFLALSYSIFLML